MEIAHEIIADKTFLPHMSIVAYCARDELIMIPLNNKNEMLFQSNCCYRMRFYYSIEINISHFKKLGLPFSE